MFFQSHFQAQQDRQTSTITCARRKIHRSKYTHNGQRYKKWTGWV